MTEMSAAERRKAVVQLKTEMKDSLARESDRRKRKTLQKEYEARIAALEGEGEAANAEADDGMQFVLKETGLKKSELKKQRQAAKRQAALEQAKQQMAETDLSAIESGRIQRHLDKDGKSVYPIAADGNCLYRALAHQISRSGTPLTYRQLREMAADYIAVHRDEYIFFLEDEYQTESGFEYYLERLQNSDDYGGEVELTAIAKILRRRVKVYQAEGPRLYNEEDEDDSPLCVSFHRHLLASCHYNSLVPTSTPCDDP